MAKVAPTPQVLSYLARACRGVHVAGRAQCRPSSTTSKSHEYRQHAFKPQAHPTRSNRSYATASEGPESSSTPDSTTSTTPDITNHYTLFPATLSSGPPPAGPFTIYPRTLRTEFLRLQSQHHPDKFPPGTPQHKTSLALSSLLNNAYRTLSDPLLRAQYLLQLKYDIDVMSEDNSSHPTDQRTLMEVMEAQEGIEEAQDQAEIETLKEENSMRIESTTEKLAKAFEAEDKETAVNECVRLKYWRSLQDGLESWEPGKEVRLIH